MFVRVVRFEGVDAERMRALKDRIEGGGGPPEGVNISRIQICVDADQGTAVVLQHYATAEDMSQAEAVFDAMDASDTPGTRASVDRCEVMLEMTS